MLNSKDKVQLYKGDCLKIMKDIPDKSVDMILCDLPYGTTSCKWDSIIPLDKLWEQYNRIIKDNGAILLFAQTPFDKVLGFSNLKMLRYEWIWEKEQGTGNLNANKMPLKKHENILVFYKKLPKYNPQFIEGKPYMITRQYNDNEIFGKTGTRDGYVKRFPTSILECSSKIAECNPINRVHPTQKPVSLLEWLIKTYTNEGETVLDNTMGSGSTGEACLRTNRNFIGIEQDDKYFDIAYNRINGYIYE